MEHYQPLLTIIATIVAGIFSLVLASKVRLPSILFFLSCGVLLGPQFAEVIQPSVFRSNFPHYISILVALILFEGGISLKISQFKEISKTLRGLLTIGVLTTLVGVTLGAHWIAGLSWDKALLFGSVMIVTGPTVVIPILHRVRIKENLHNVLKWEAILIDSLGVIIAIVLFEFLVSNHSDVLHGILFFIGRFVIGIALGLACGWVMVQGLTRHSLLQFEGEELGGLFVLSTVLLFYGLAEMILPESGLVVTTVAGLYFGNQKFALKEQIIHFKKQVTLFALSCLFVLLSANVPVRKIQSVLIEGSILLVFMIFVIRPLGVFLSTRKDSNLTVRDKIFLSFMAPRGIVSASLASLFAIAFEERALSGRGVFLPLAFHVIIGSILFYAVFSGIIARFLNVREEKGRGILIVGANSLGMLLGEELRKKEVPVMFIDTNPLFCNDARQRGFHSFCGSGFDREFLEEVDIKGISKMIAVTPNHEVNLLTCQALSSYLGKKNVYRLWDSKDSWKMVNSPEFDESRGKPVCITSSELSYHEILDFVDERKYEIRFKKIDRAIKFTEEALKNFNHEMPLFAKTGTGILFAYPGTTLPAQAEFVTLCRRIEPAESVT